MNPTQEQIDAAHEIVKSKISENPKTGELTYTFLTPLKNTQTGEEYKSVTIPPLKGYHAESLLTGIDIGELGRSVPKIAMRTVALFTSLHEKEVGEQTSAKDLLYIYLAVQRFLV